VILGQGDGIIRSQPRGTTLSDEHPWNDEQPRYNWLAEYRLAVDRLRDETVDEFGAQPMPPEKLSMIAVALASLPLMAMLLPTVPFSPTIWQVTLVQAAVWLVAFGIQRRRYERFQAAWRGKVIVYRAAIASPQVAPRFLARH
jgi:hypothetical protein